MHETGWIAPETESEFHDRFEALGPAARTVVKEVAKATGLDAEEYRERVTSETVETGRDAMFASLLQVTVGTREEYEAWREDYDGEVYEAGSENVEYVVWHAVPFAGEAVAATFQQEERAAVATLRRQAYGRIYEDYIEREEPA